MGALSLILLWAPGIQANPPYKRMLDEAVTFTGREGAPADPAGLASVALGLFAPGRDQGPEGREVHRGISMAMALANGEGGYEGVPFQVVRRWDEKPWAQGSSEMVRLAWVDRVWAVMASLSGSSNIAQQIATKAYLPVVSPVSTDRTLTRARVPWTFRLAPDDRALSRLLIARGIKPAGFRRVGLVTTVDHDGRTAGGDLLSEMNASGVPPLFHFALDAGMDAPGEAARRIVDFSPDALLMHLPPADMTELLGELRAAGVNCPLFVPWLPGFSGAAASTVYGGALVTAEPFDMSSQREKLLAWRKGYGERFGSAPTFTAAYAYDAACLIVEAVRGAGLSRGGIRERFGTLSGYEGVSGTIQWDNGGSNMGKPVLGRYLPAVRAGDISAPPAP